MPPAEVAALIAAGATIFVTIAGFIVQGVILNSRIERMRLQSSITVEVLKHNLERNASYQKTRQDQLQQLVNAASIAESAAHKLLGITKLTAEEHEELLSKTGEALKQISVFLQSVSDASQNVHLNQGDISRVSTVKADLIKMFFSLDMDAGGTPEYVKKMAGCHAAVKNSFEDFKSYVISLSQPDVVVE